MIDRREFTKRGLAALSLSACTPVLRGAIPKGGLKSLVPDRAGLAPNYWSTWGAQNYIYGDRGNRLDEMDEEILTDDWLYQPGQTWYSESVGQLARQGAPARISRNLPLPEVAIGRESNGERPFVFAGRFPNGAVAVGMQERTHVHSGWTAPRAEVRVDVSDALGPFGIFGYFEAVTLSFREFLKNRRVIAEDLAGGSAVDVSPLIEIRGGDLRIPGSVIEGVGLGAAIPGDLSNPGLILQVV